MEFSNCCCSKMTAKLSNSLLYFSDLIFLFAYISSNCLCFLLYFFCVFFNNFSFLQFICYLYTSIDFCWCSFHFSLARHDVYNNLYAFSVCCLYEVWPFFFCIQNTFWRCFPVMGFHSLSSLFHIYYVASPDMNMC